MYLIYSKDLSILRWHFTQKYLRFTRVIYRRSFAVASMIYILLCLSISGIFAPIGKIAKQGSTRKWPKGPIDYGTVDTSHVTSRIDTGTVDSNEQYSYDFLVKKDSRKKNFA